jgi:Fe-S oxidoreductase/nitrate reductase gamma subunit
MLKDFDIFFILLALAFLCWGLWRRFRLWRIGKIENRSEKMWARIRAFLVDGIVHKRILKDFYPGFLHLLLFFGFLLPLLVILIAQFVFALPPFIARPLSLVLDLLALAALLSLVLLIWRRYVTKPQRLDNRADDLVTLVLILFIVLSGLFLEAVRLAVTDKDAISWAPVGKVIAALLNSAGLSISSNRLLAMILFRVHFFLVLGAIAYITYSKLFHIISSPLNMIFRSLEPKGALSHINLEDEQAKSFGVSKIEEFTWKQLMDLDACTRCGRCQDHCPAHLSQKPLSPKAFIIDLRDHMRSRAPQVLDAKSKKKELKEIPALVGSVIEKETLWACTTCRSCMEHCPVYVEHVAKIIDMRRYQVLMESKFPEELTTAFKGLERNSNPWGMGFEARADWIKELNVPLMAEVKEKDIDFLLFVGCIRSYDDRNKKVSKSMAKILNLLHIQFAILGTEEGCCGDPARRLGNEYLYQTLARVNIETFKRYNIKRILTTCPHCYNTLKNEYPQLGFSCELIHHAQFLEENIRSGRLKLEHGLAKKLTYHDPCYLGRYSGLYQPPRDVLRSIPSLNIREMRRSRADSLCCGGGGGWMWMDEKIGKRMNAQRLEDALAVKADWIATACPFCVTMFEDAVKDKGMEQALKVWDIAEIVEKAIFGIE